MQGVVKEIVSRYEGSGVSAVLYDGERFQREADAKAIDNGKRRRLSNVETFSLADRELVVVAQTLPGFIGRRMSWHPEATLIVGLLMTTLLLTYLVTTFRRSSQVELLAEKLSAEVAERKRVAEARERLVLELEAKNAELERFTYTVSHDLKSPLITIRGFTGLLAKDAEKGDMVRVSGDVDQIKRATDKMQQLLEELLELSRIGRLVNPSKNISLADLAREAVEMLSGRISKGKVDVTIQPGLPTVFGDRPRLLEVFQNLIDNAVKFMGDQPAPHIEIGVENRGKEVLCFVRDNGIGIHPRYQSKVFGLFERLDQNLEGTGIGLALVQRIINYHGGRIWIESEGEGKGSTFIFSLPSETKEDKADEN
ncbi:MAG: GHKL domain-containing protein [Deltaproteobacteria bacterium]|nr:GHKL domain-containing protein [Deltaproteobacteria bacterium]